MADEDDDALCQVIPTEEEVDLSGSLLHTVEWGRIVLDEAHKIKAGPSPLLSRLYSLLPVVSGTALSVQLTPRSIWYHL